MRGEELGGVKNDSQNPGLGDWGRWEREHNGEVDYRQHNYFSSGHTEYGFSENRYVGLELRRKA